MIWEMFTKTLIITISIKKKKIIIIVFDDMIVDMINNRRLDLIVTELFIREKKLNISLVFITLSYFKVPKDIRLNTTHFFIAKTPNKRELQQTAISRLISIENVNIYRERTVELYSFFVNDTTLALDNPLGFRKLFLKYNENHDN